MGCRWGHPEPRRSRGQVFAELALALPVLLFGALGLLEAGLLIGSRDQQARLTQVVADYAAARPGDSSWHAVAAHELPGCDVQVIDSGHPDIVAFHATCPYHSVTRLAFDGLPVSTEASAAAAPAPTPTPTPTAAPTP